MISWHASVSLGRDSLRSLPRISDRARLMYPPYGIVVDGIPVSAGSRRVVFSSATGRSQVVRAAAGRYMRHDPLFVGGGIEGDNQRRVAGLPANIRHLIVTVPKVNGRINLLTYSQ